MVAASAGGLAIVTVTGTLPAASVALTTPSPAIGPTVTVVALVSGGVVSVDVHVPVPEPVLPAGSVTAAVTSPSGCSPGAVAVHSPVVPSAVTSDVVPSGHVTVTVEPGSVVPEAVGMLSPSGSVMATFVVGGVTSTVTGPTEVTGPMFPDASI
ncbi:hypothetical protein Brsp03_02785 [Brucella sp. NBRC 12951]